MLFGGKHIAIDRIPIHIHVHATGTASTNEDDAALSQHIIGGTTSPLARTAGCIYHTEYR